MSFATFRVRVLLAASLALVALVLVVYARLAGTAGTLAPSSPTSNSQLPIPRFGSAQLGLSAFSPGGDTLASVNEGGSISLRDVASNQTSLILPGSFGDLATRVGFSSDGKTLVSIAENVLTLWDVASGRSSLTFPLEASAPVETFVFGPDSKTLAGVITGSGVVLWNAEQGSSKHIPITGDITSGVAFSPDGGLVALAVGGAKPEVELWDVSTGAIRGAFPATSVVTGVQFSPDGQVLASSGQDGRITLLNRQTGLQKQTAPGDGSVSDFVFSRDGKLLASTGDDAQIKLWDAATGDARASFQTDGAGAITGLAFSPDGATLAAVGSDNAIRLWEQATGRLLQVLVGHTAAVEKLAFSSTQPTLAALARDGQLIVWDLATGLEVLAYQIPQFGSSTPSAQARPVANGLTRAASSAATTASSAPATGGAPAVTAGAKAALPSVVNLTQRRSAHDWKGVAALAVSPDGTNFVGGDKDGTIRVWNALGRELATLVGHNGKAVTGVAFSADGRRVVSVGRDTELRTWDARTGKLDRAFRAHEHPIRAVAVSPDGKWYASAGEETRIMVWNAVTGKIARVLGGHVDFVNAVSFSADSKLLASGGADSRIVLWDVQTGKRVKTFLGHSGEVNALGFSRDGQFLASGSSDSLVKLWDVGTGRQLKSLSGHQAAVRTLAFSPDGKSLVSAGEDTKILVWDMVTRALSTQIAGTARAVNALAFTPRGSLVSGSEDGKVSELEPATGKKVLTIDVPLLPQSRNSSAEAAGTAVALGAADSPGGSGYSGGDAPKDSAPTLSRLFGKALSWLIPAAEAADPNTDAGPGGPILVITAASNPFGRYLTEILRTEGFNAFTVADISSVTAGMLASYDVAILAQMSLSAAQVTMLSNWVTGGGNLIAMKPDPQLAGLFGLTATGATLSNGYLLVDTATSPGNGIVGQTIQFHGPADRYTLNGASSVATLYSNAGTATTNPAVTLRSVGGSGGQAAAFTYDLSTSIVYTRQGNPAWESQERDGFSPIRSDDKYYGNAAFDPQADWVDLNKVSIPQADEQQRLLANLILEMNRDRKPLPRFWYFPRGKKAVVVMTGDDHGNAGTIPRFDYFIAQSPAGCSVANWECIRGTSYIFPNTPMTKAQADAYEAAGFEVGLHLNTNCGDFDATSLENFYNQQVQDWTTKYVGAPSTNMPAGSTQRHHCIAWSDWVTGAEVQFNHGIRLDTSYYYWPPNWVQNRPGLFNGSGMPMRFTRLNGTMVDVYHAASQMTDESGQTYPFTIESLLDRAIGAEQYVGAFVINAHTDVHVLNSEEPSTVAATNTVTAAKNRGVPVISSRQLLTWLDARNGSTFDAMTWAGNALTFTVTPGSGSTGLQAWVPAQSAAGVVTGVTRNGTPISFGTEAFKGITYVTFATANGGDYVVSYATDTVAPTVTARTPAPGATGVSVGTTVTATFSEPIDLSTINGSTFELRTSGGTLIAASVSYDAATRTATVTPSASLAALTAYTTTVKGGTTGPRVKDLAGNPLAADVNWNFTTAALPCSTTMCSAWSSSTVPSIPSVSDPNAVELGVRFRSDLAGAIAGVRFYQVNPGSYVGNLWTSSGALLATASFTATTPGWQQVNFTAPVSIDAGTVYIASYHAPNGNYAADNGYFASAGVDNGPIHLLRDGESGANGLYAYSGGSTFPTNSFQSSNYWVDVAFTTDVGPDSSPPTLIAQNPASGATGVSTATTLTATFSEAMDASTVTSSTFELRDAANTVVTAAVAYDATTRTATLTPSGALVAETVYTATIRGGAADPRVKDLAGNALASDATWTFTTGPAPAPGCSGAASIWPSNPTPSVVSDPDTASVELGVKFRSSQNGVVCGIRFYKGSANTGIHVGKLWSSTGQLLASVTFTGETTSGWQQANFASPIAITAGTTYVASYLAPVGRYSVNGNYFASAVTSGPLSALSNAESGGNGVYLYGSGGFPVNSFQAANYWVDVLFTTDSGPDTTPPLVTATTPVANETDVNVAGSVTVTFNEAMDAASITASSFELRDAGDAPVAATVSYNAAGLTATLTPAGSLSAGATYTAIVRGGATDPRVKDAAGNALASDLSWSFTTAPAAAAGCAAGTTSIWPSNPTPSVTDSDTGSVELGVKFRSSANGYICGIRYYKSTANTGTHVGKLWSSAGELLASATFTNESASGWQQVNFASPVPIIANQTYVASYLAPAGRYSINENYFGAGVASGPLYAFGSAESGGNGVYLYGPGGFPTDTHLSTNYWVDVAFTTDIGPDTTAPTVSSTNPAANSTSVSPVGAVTATFSEFLDSASVGASSFELRAPGNTLVPASVSYSGTTATLTPANALADFTAYTAKVLGGSNGVKDLAGNPLASDFNWSFTTGVNPCAPGGNAIICENAKPGNPASEWDVNGIGDESIQGYATEISVNRGETVRFKIDTPSTDYRLDIYRMGYYGGNGARKVATVQPSASLPQNQPDCLTNATGLIDCGNWAESASWAVPSDATSGIYFAKAVREDGANTGASHIVFIVRDDASTSDILFQTSDTTWQAYNTYGGNSLYTGSPAGRAYKVSYNRPFSTRIVDNGQDWLFNAEYPMVRWLEANGYNVSYFTGVDSDRLGNLIAQHKVLLSVGHDEYWSGAQRQNVEAARDAGVHMAFFSGNEVFWKTRWENSIASSGAAYRTLVCYKETHANATIDPLDVDPSPIWTGTWRDPRFSPPADGGRPENALTGTIFMVNDGATTSITVPEADGKMRFWRNTTIANLPAGASATLPFGTLGYEWDEDLDNGFRPSGLVRLSTTVVPGAPVLQDFGSTYGSGTATHALTLYKAVSGAIVFGAGTVQWPWGLDSHHDRAGTATDVSMQQATVNLFADMGVQPGTLQSGLLSATASTDATAPSSAITAPASGSSVTPGSVVAISGTAADTGGRVGGVEVSTDGGLTWHAATGRGTWTYNWTAPTTNGQVNIKSRAVDDSLNLQTPGGGITVNIGTGTDTTPPSAPSNLMATGTSGTQVSLGWIAATDNVGVTGYRVERCQEAGCVNFSQIGTPTSNSYADSGLTEGTTYRYRVRAVDAAGNLGPYSGVAAVIPDATAPTAPSGLNASATSATQISLTWTASTDNVGVAEYRVERCQGAGCSTFIQIGSPTTTSYGDSGLAAATTYQFRVRAVDAAGNLSPYSAVVSGTTLAGSANTGLLNPASNAPVTNTLLPLSLNGDGNGFQSNPTNAYADGSGVAVDTNSGTNTNTSCTNSGKDKHVYYNYGINVPGSATVLGIEVRLDARVDATAGTPRMCVQLSSDGGSTWTAAKTTATLTSSEATYLLGGPADSWGRAWTATDLGNANFRVRIINIASNTSRDFSLDWLAVRVTYQ